MKSFCQMMTLDKGFFDEPARRLSAKLMRIVDSGLRITLSLDPT
ncbi:MAG TPA: hypothetical protein VH062_36395 [Polyangiaceae bacterium]|nr:hypothetical protein [Polyangiaceae bacterium]